MEINTSSVSETQAAGRKVAGALLSKGIDHAVLALTGELGAGKTTFIQGFAEGLNIKQRIISPTFILVRKYSLDYPYSNIRDFYHVDLYRLESNIERELVNIGITDLINAHDSIIAIEWADKISDYFPKDTIWISFENSGTNGRKIKVKNL